MKKILSLFACLVIATQFTLAVSYKNIAIGKHVGALGSLDMPYPGYHVTDNDDSTVWAVSTGSDQWIYIDLGEEKNIDGIRINWYESYYAKRYDIIYANKNVDPFTEIAVSETNGDGVIDEHFFSKKVRYIGLKLHKKTGLGSSNYVIKEFEVLVQEAPGTTVSIKRSISFTGAIANSLPNHITYSAFDNADYNGFISNYPNYSDIHLADTRLFLGYSLGTIPAGSTIVSARVSHQIIQRGSTQTIPEYLSVYKGFQLENIKYNAEQSYNNEDWQIKYGTSVYKRVTTTTSDKEYMICDLSGDALVELQSALDNNEHFKIACKLDERGEAVKYNLPHIHLQVEYK